MFFLRSCAPSRRAKKSCSSTAPPARPNGWGAHIAALASCAAASLACGALAAAAEPHRIQEAPRPLVLALGEGLEPAGQRRWTAELQAMLQRVERPHHLLDLRQPELSVRTLHEEFDQLVLSRDPDLVVLQIGGRDSRPRRVGDELGPEVSAEEFEWHLRDMLDEFVRREIDVLLLTPDPRVVAGAEAPAPDVLDADGLVATTAERAELVRRLARNTGCELLDAHGFLKERHRQRPLVASDTALPSGASPVTVPVRVPEAATVELAQRIAEKLMDRRRPTRRRPGSPARDLVRWVDAGRVAPGPVRWSGAPWIEREGFLEGEPSSGRLCLDATVLPGDFDLTLRAVPTLGEGAGLSLHLGGSSLSFERAPDGRLGVILNGPLWRGVEAPTCAVPALDRPLELELRRRHRRELELWVAGERVLRHFHAGRLDAWSLAAGSGARLYSVALAGGIEERRAPLASEPRLPQLDLAAEVERQTIVDREAGQYLGHVSTLTLDDGAILAAYPKGHGRGPIVMKRSDDGGASWSERLPLPENFATSAEVPTLWRCVDAQGTRRIVLFSGLYPVRQSVSEDEGRTWTPLEPAGHWGGIVAMGDVIPLAKRGHYLALFHDDGRFRYGGGGRGVFSVLASQSTDGGLTWGEPRVIARLPYVDLCEPGFARSPDGNELAVCLRENSRTRNSFLITSRDEGRTWSEPVELPADLTGDRHTLRYAPDGRLVITFRDTGSASATAGDWVVWVGTYDDLVSGRPGQYRARLMDNHHRWDCAYPGLELLPDGSFVATTYGHWTPGEQPYIVSVRFALSELDERLAAEEPAAEEAPLEESAR